ncbi:MAG: hypothetical protein EGR21_01230 [Faecalibacterium prausnitzii]|nr:hypothetical protein [Faecalibacterium prausnitzii]
MTERAQTSSTFPQRRAFVESGAATAVFLYDLSCENGFGVVRVCAAMKAPVGLLSGRAVCVSRWRGFAPTSSADFPETRNYK